MLLQSSKTSPFLLATAPYFPLPLIRQVATSAPSAAPPHRLRIRAHAGIQIWIKVLLSFPILRLRASARTSRLSRALLSMPRVKRLEEVIWRLGKGRRSATPRRVTGLRRKTLKNWKRWSEGIRRHREGTWDVRFWIGGRIFICGHDRCNCDCNSVVTFALRELHFWMKDRRRFCEEYSSSRESVIELFQKTFITAFIRLEGHVHTRIRRPHEEQPTKKFSGVPVFNQT